MNMHTNNFRKNLVVLGMAAIVATVLVSGGCAPLKKKFTRAKKKDTERSEDFVPVLDPIEYPRGTYSAVSQYTQHYSLWKVWFKELVSSIETGASDKRQVYLLNQLIEQLQGMQEILVEDKQSELGNLVGELQDLAEEYEKPAAMRSKFAMESKVERNARKVRNGFAPGMVFPEE